ncbi:hypothetical protein NEOLEDRAFT_1246079 [Neolentinus lepideus HHB14362 ss-1]|uniref:Calcineurin-like phosphoesterase domain-containing protein n=1 Tax=Neolentinus lepideus HHB14362 ss-1 TaxID=1314782 RepID=A0A165N1W0_9AGAM|nr:hypothetical protein NEOLEDRAFT_1246079 [Neolentinus lepideus HHB14362 ss-1]
MRAGLLARRPGRFRLSRGALLNGLRLFWIVFVFWAEVGVYFYSIVSCSWPDKSLTSAGQLSERPAHILLVADPQVRSPSLPSPSRWTWTGWRQSILDFSTKKSWNVLSRSGVDVVIFLGDMLASGRVVSSENEYMRYVDKFWEVFPMQRLKRGQIPALVYFIPGNEDIGLGKSIYYSKNARREYVKHFGPLNQKVYIRNHTFALLNAPGLVDEDYQRAGSNLEYEYWDPIPGGSVSFIETIREDPNGYPVVLFSHIPLGRPDTASCGPLREKGTILRGVGPSYQNTIGKQTATYVLESLQPSMVFSADDRDYCDYTHVLSPSRSNPSGNKTHIREVTVKSFSFAKTIQQPGYHLLSVISPSSASQSQSQLTLADRPCLLPNPFTIYSSACIPLIFLSFLVLLASEWHFHRTKRLHLHRSSSPHLSISPVPFADTNGTSFYRLSQHTSQPDSAVWSPSTPGTKQPSPQGLLPSVRTPLSAPLGLAARSLSAPTLRATQSRPGTPLLSPAHSTLLLPHADEEDMMNLPVEDQIHSSGRTTPYEHSRYDEASDREEDAFFLPTADGTHQKVSHQDTWTWTFVLFGRRRRMSLRRPSLLLAVACVGNVLSGRFLQDMGLQKSIAARRRSSVMMWAVLLDAFAAAWSVAAFWWMLTLYLRWVI